MSSARICNRMKNYQSTQCTWHLFAVMLQCPIINKKFWNLKISLRVKIFPWYLRRGVILTRNNLAKRNWCGSKQCCFCHHDEKLGSSFLNAQDSLHGLAFRLHLICIRLRVCQTCLVMGYAVYTESLDLTSWRAQEPYVGCRNDGVFEEKKNSPL